MRLKQIAMIAMLVAIGCVQAENFLRNPSFEEVDSMDASRPKWWDRLCTIQDRATLGYEKGKAFDGERSLLLQTDAVKDDTIVIWRHPKLGTAMNILPEGTEMELSMRVFSEQRTKCAIYFPYAGIPKEVTTTGNATPGGWRLIRTTFKLEHHPIGNVYVRSYGPGAIWVDSVYLGPARSEAETVAARPFAEWTPKDNGGESVCRIVTPGLSTSHALFLQSEKNDSCPAWTALFPPTVLKDATPGAEYAFRINANTHAIAATCFMLSVNIAVKDGEVLRHASPPISIYQGTEKASLKFKVPQKEITGITATVTLTTAGRLTFDSPTFIVADNDVDNGAFATKNDEYCRILGQPQRRTWKLPSLPKAIKIGCNLPADKLKTTIVDILHETTVATLQIANLTPHQDNTLTLDLPTLPCGCYEFIFECGEGIAALREYDYMRVVPDDFTQRITFRDDRVFMLDGKPFFPIVNSYTLQTPESFRVNSQSGINVINMMASDDPGEWRYINAVAKQYGMHVTWWNSYIYTGQYSDERIRADIESTAFAIDGIDTLLGFFDDESAWCGVSSEWMRKACRIYFAKFPHLLLSENHAPVMHGPPSDFRRAFHNIRRFTGFTDIASVDIYPVPDGRASYADLPSGNRSLSCVGEFTDAVLRCGWKERPVLMILQNWALSEAGGNKPTEERPRPTYRELRFMAWNAITHGATGISWHGEGNDTGHGGNADFYSEYWQGFADVNREISKAMEIYINLHGNDMSLPAQDGNVRCIARGNDQSCIIVAVNEDGKNSHDFTLPQGRQFHASPKGDIIDGATVNLKPYEVLIATDKRLVIPPTPRFTPASPECPVPCPYQCVLINSNWTSHPEYPRSNGAMSFFFKHDVVIPDGAKEILLQICGDDAWSCEIGAFSAKGKEHTTVYQFDLSKRLSAGKAQLKGRLDNVSGTTGIVYAVICDGKAIASSGKDTMFSVDGDSWANGMERGLPPVGPWGRPKRFVIR